MSFGKRRRGKEGNPAVRGGLETAQPSPTAASRRHPPSVPLDEGAIAPEWEKLAPEVAAMFDWAHMLHRQIYDVWTDDRIRPLDKDARVAAVIAYYKSRRALALSSTGKC